LTSVLPAHNTVRVLLIEDNEDDAYLIRRLLNRSLLTKFQLQVVDELAAGLDLLATNGFDVVLLDLTVRDSFGLETLHKAQASVPDVPIVVMTSLSDEALGVKAVQLGAQDYLVKGEVDTHLLVRAINYAVERKQAERELRRHRAHLEELVAERTAELTEINRQLAQQIIVREQAELAEREQRQFAEALRDISNALHSTHNLSDVLDRILANVERVVPFDFAEVSLFEGGKVRIARAQGYDEDTLARLLDMVVPLSDVRHLNRLFETAEPVLFPDVLDCRDEITILHDAGWRSYVGIPIRHQDEIIGCISLMRLETDFFTAVHVDRLQAFAEQAAIAIQSARFYEQAQALAAIQERERLARDLHDAVSQALFSATMITEALPAQWRRNPERVPQLLADLHRLIRGALAEMRTLLLELRPKSLLEASLIDLLNQLVDAIQSRKNIHVELDVDEQVHIPPEIKVALYRITQEALNNVSKHTLATNVRVSLRRLSHGVELSITDDGQGFDPAMVSSTSLGLSIMRERAEAINAALTIDTQPNSGTRIAVLWPGNSR